MAQLILPSRRIAQPQGAVEIDRANRYGAAHLYGVAGLTAPGSSVDGVVLSNTGGVTRSADVIDFTGVAGNRLTFPSTPSRIGQQFTIIARVKKRATNKHDSIFDTKRVADWDTNYGFAFNLKDDGGALFKVGASEAYTFTNYTNNSNWHVLAAVYYAGTKQDIYIDGAEVSYYFHAISSAHNPLSNALICGAYYDFSSNRTSNLLVEYAHIFDGAFTLDEINKFARQPWQIFKPRNNRIYFDVGAGGTEGAVLEGSASGAASASGALTTGIPIAGAALSVASASGTLAVGIPLSGAAAAMSTASGSLTAQLTLAGSALAQAVSSALLSSGITMTAAAVAQAAADGTLTTAIQMLGGAQAQAGGSGSLTTSTGGLEGNAQASASASASLSTQIRLSGAAIASAGASGSLGGSANLAGTAVSTASASGELTVNIALTAQALASAIAAGALTAQINLAGNAVASVAAGASLTVPLSYIVPAQRTISRVQVTSRIPATQTSRR